MPLHEFVCTDCGREFEELVFKEEEIVSCPECGSNNASKLMSACRFKTGGPIVQGSPSSSAVTSRGSSCSGCSGGSCSTC